MFQKITPCLWFNDQAEEAARFYIIVFKNSKIRNVNHYTESPAEATGRPKGSVMTVTFLLEGREFTGLNGGPAFQPSSGIRVSRLSSVPRCRWISARRPLFS